MNAGAPPPPPPPPTRRRPRPVPANRVDVAPLDVATSRRLARWVLLALLLLTAAAVALLNLPHDDADAAGSKAESQSTQEQSVACGGRAVAARQPAVVSRGKLPRLRSGSDYEAVITTSCGDIILDLLERDARRAVRNFVYLARRGFYDGLLWHQVVYDNFIVTGDPNGDPARKPDGAGYEFNSRPSRASKRLSYGDVALVETPDGRSQGSQFFITAHAYKQARQGRAVPLAVDRPYTVFARATHDSFPTIETIARQQVDPAAPGLGRFRPLLPVYSESVDIVSRETRS